MSRSASFLQRSRHGTTFFFRRVVPPDLRNRLGRTQLYRSLHTSDRTIAVRVSRILAVATDRFFDELRRMTDPKDKRDPRTVYGDLWGSWGSPVTDQMGSIPPQPVKPRARPTVAFRSPTRDQVHQTSTDAPNELTADLTMMATLPDGTVFRIETAPTDTPEQIAAAASELVKLTDAKPTDKPQLAAPKREGRSYALRAGVADYLAHVQASKSPSTLKAYRHTLEVHFLPHVDDTMSVRGFSQEKFATFAKMLHQRDSGSTANTRNQRLTHVCALFEWLKSVGRVEHGLTSKNLTVDSHKSESEERAAHTLDHVAVFFNNAARYKAHTPEIFWATVAVAFMGCRIEELSQIDVTTDLVQHQSGWVIKFTSEVGSGAVTKRLKNKVSRRDVPIHSALVESGFVDFLKAAESNPNRRPFERWQRPRYTNGRDPKWSHGISKWASREKKKLAKLHGWSDDITYFHSGRHGITTHLADQGLPESVRADLLGQQHAGAGINDRRYRKKSAERLVDTLEKNLGAYVELLHRALAHEVEASSIRPRKRRGRSRRLKSASI